MIVGNVELVDSLIVSISCTVESRASVASMPETCDGVPSPYVVHFFFAINGAIYRFRRRARLLPSPHTPGRSYGRAYREVRVSTRVSIVGAVQK